MTRALVLRDVTIEGRPGLDVRIEGGRIAEIGPALAAAGPSIDGRGGALLPGLVDHHIHLLGLAAQAASIVLDRAPDAAGFADAIRAGAGGRPAGAWLRATGYHERMAGEIGREALDRLAPDHRLRVQDQTGALWVLNSRALESVVDGEPPPFVERDADGRLTGRIWRGDAWLRERIGREPPDLAAIGRTLASFGLTGLTDASASTDESAAGLLADAHRSGALPQRLMLMSAGPLAPPPDGAFAVGPVKVLLDDARLPDFDDVLATIRRARAWNRRVAVHCVTAAEFALTLAAFETAGAVAGDRIEHGGVIPPEAMATLAALGLTVVTQPGFVFERGDRYLAEVDAADQGDLYRCASLMAAGVPVAGSSDAPYASPDPWSGVRAAIRRRTRGGGALGEHERVDPRTALRLYLGRPDAPGGEMRRVAVGEPADLCLLKGPLAAALAEPDAELVAATLVGGEAVYVA